MIIIQQIATSLIAKHFAFEFSQPWRSALTTIPRDTQCYIIIICLYMVPHLLKAEVSQNVIELSEPTMIFCFASINVIVIIPL